MTFWTAIEIAELRHLANVGKTVAEASAALGRPVESIRYRAKEDRLRFRRKAKPVAWPASDDAVLRAEYLKGTRAAAIGKMLGRTKGSVIGRASRLNLEHQAGDSRLARHRHYSPILGRTDETPPSNRCQFPRGQAPDYDFCGATIRIGSPYCEEHCVVAYRGRDYTPAAFLRVGYR